jgi:hypothetical protein
MTEEFTKGLTCCHCQSVLFTVDMLVSHAVKNPGHRYYKWGEGEGILFIKPMLEYYLAGKNWDSANESSG